MMTWSMVCMKKQCPEMGGVEALEANHHNHPWRAYAC